MQVRSEWFESRISNQWRFSLFVRFFFVNKHSGAKQLHGSLLYIEVVVYVNQIAFLRASNKKVK